MRQGPIAYTPVAMDDIDRYLELGLRATRLGPHDALLPGIGALGALGRTAELGALLDVALSEPGDDTRWYEAVLQLVLFAGYPRAINALASLEAARERVGRTPPPAPPPTAPGPADVDRWWADGQALCARIYGPRYERLIERMSALSPELATWMLLEGYGKVLSRPGLDPGSRELVVIGALTALETGPQLSSHLEGALRVGETSEALDEALALLATLLPADAVARAARRLATVREETGLGTTEAPPI